MRTKETKKKISKTEVTTIRIKIKTLIVESWQYPKGSVEKKAKIEEIKNLKESLQEAGYYWAYDESSQEQIEKVKSK